MFGEKALEKLRAKGDLENTHGAVAHEIVSGHHEFDGEQIGLLSAKQQPCHPIFFITETIM